ncbi:MAG: YhgE/Pip family protein [Firmicutes bacterium]|nr:YhgE/Pip family protein [Bacillota bacterium]
MDENIRNTLGGVADAADSGQAALDEAGQTLETGRRLYGDFSLDLERNLTESSDYLAGIRYKSDLDFYDLNARTQTVNKKISSAIETLQAVSDRDAEIISSLEALNQDLAFSETNTLLTRMKEENQSNQELLDALRSANQAAGDAADKTFSNAALVQDEVSESRSRISSAADLYKNDVKTKLSADLDQVSYFLGVFDGLLEPVDSDIAQMETILAGLDQSMDRLNQTLEDTQSTLDGVRDQVDNLKADLDLLQGTETYQKILSASIDGEELSGFLSSPVSVKTKTFFSVRTYGTAMSPFFTNLSIWVGGIVLLALFKLEVDTDEEIRKFRPSEGYIGRGLLFALVGIGQAVIVCLGDLFLLKIQCEHPVLFVLGGMMASFVYVSLIYALGTTLKHVGKALCIVILIFQVPGSSGTYPVEMTSLFFRVIHPFLPFTYGINAMREAEIGIYGHHYALYMVKLSLFLIFAWVLGLGLRPLFINLNVLFDKKLAETDLMICDPAGQEQERFRLMAAMRLLAGRERFQSTVGASIERFEKGYSKRISQSFRLVLIALPVVFLLLMFITGGSKILFLVLWVVSLMALMIFQIIIEYIREHLDRQKRMMELSDQELIQLLNGEASMDDSAKGNAEEGTEDPTDETEDVPADESGESPVDESLEETADEGTEDPTDEVEKASAEEAVEASESESAGEAEDEAEEAPAEEAGEVSVDESAGETAGEAAETPAEEAGEASLNESAGEAAGEAEEAPAEEAGEVSVDESAGETSEEEAEEALADETGEELTGRTGKEDGLE